MWPLALPARQRRLEPQPEERTHVAAPAEEDRGPEQQAEAHSIALERHHALNWLSGEGDDWDDVPLMRRPYHTPGTAPIRRRRGAHGGRRPAHRPARFRRVSMVSKDRTRPCT